MLFEALCACAGVMVNAVAAAIGVNIHSGKVYAEGDLDFRGTLSVSKEVPVGFHNIHLRFELDADADDEKLSNLLRLTEMYCVVY